MTKQDLTVVSSLKLGGVRQPQATPAPTSTLTAAPQAHTIPEPTFPQRSSSVAELWSKPIPVFTALVGPAGSGKTFGVQEWAEAEKGIELVATTGIAAINLGGSTINSYLGYFDTRSLQESWQAGFLAARLGKLWRMGIRRLVLDEMSMLDGDALTLLVKGIEEVNGRGYVLKTKQDQAEAEESELPPPAMGLTLVGDFAQLRPVNAPYAFESIEWQRTSDNNMDRFQESLGVLKDIRRQSDRVFIEMLRAARRGDGVTVAAYFANSLQSQTDDLFDGPTIVAKNETVDKYNWLRLSRLDTPSVIFESRRWGQQRAEWGSEKKPPNKWGVPMRLQLKVGALVMVLANKRYEGPPPQPYQYVNGDLGELVDASVETNTAYVKLQRTGVVEPVTYIRREMVQPCDSARRKELREQHLEHLISADGKREIVGWIEYLPLRLAYATTVHKCCKADTLVPVVDQGLQRLQDVRVGAVTPYGQVIGVAQVTKRAFRVTSKRGYRVICSAEHRWLLNTGLRETQALQVGDRIELAQVFHLQGDSTAISPELAWWLGVLVGDGYYANADHHIELTNDDPTIRHRFGALLQQRGLRIQKTPLNRVRCQSKAFRDYLEGLGLARVTAADKRVPERIWSTGSTTWGEFLAGLYDADGSVSTKRVCLTTVSTLLAEEVQLLLLYLGVPSKRTVFQSGYKGRGGVYYQINVAPAYMEKFFRSVPLSHPKKASMAAAYDKMDYNRILKPFDGFDEIAAIEDLGELLPMVDIELAEAPHLCAFGPFVGHNSQGLSLDRVQVNIRDPFFKEPGMLYVALSRARTAEGLRLVGSRAAIVERCVSDPRLKEWL